MLLVPGRPAYAQSDSTIVGVVVDAVTGEPVEHATVILVGTLHATITGADGRFELGPVTFPPYVVGITASGFAPVQATGVSGRVISIEMTREQVQPLLHDPLMARRVRLPGVVLGLGSALRMPDIASASGGPFAAPVVRGLWSKQVAIVEGDLPVVRTGGTSSLTTIFPGDRVILVPGPYALTWGAGVLSAVRIEKRQRGGQFGSYGIRARDVSAAAAPTVTWSTAELVLRMAFLNDGDSRRSSVGTQAQWGQGGTKAGVDAGYVAEQQQRAHVSVKVRRDMFRRMWRSVSVTASGQRWRVGPRTATVLAARAAARLAAGSSMEMEWGSDVVHVAPIAGAAQTIAALFMRSVLVRNDVTMDVSGRVDVSARMHPSMALTVSVPVSEEWNAVGAAGTASRLVDAGEHVPRVWQSDLQLRTDDSATGVGMFLRKLEYSAWPANGTAWGGEIWAERLIGRYITLHGASSVIRHLDRDSFASLPITGAAGLTLAAPRNILRAGAMVWVAARQAVISGYVTVDAWAEILTPGDIQLRLSWFNVSDDRNRLDYSAPTGTAIGVPEPGRTWNLRLVRNM